MLQLELSLILSESRVFQRELRLGPFASSTLLGELALHSRQGITLLLQSGGEPFSLLDFCLA